MDKTVPAPAAKLLEFISHIETGRRPPECYRVIYGHNQDKLVKPLTSMTIEEVLTWGPKWANQFGSSACGAYQFMAGKNHTLQGLKDELGLRDGQVFDADLQDRLGYHLLIRRGYPDYMAGTLSRTEFGKQLAQEWASLPVLAGTKGAHRQVTRGQSYYSGDPLNKSLVSPEKVEELLTAIRSHVITPPDPAPTPQPSPPPPPKPPIPAPHVPDGVGIGFTIGAGLTAIVAAVAKWLGWI